MSQNTFTLRSNDVGGQSTKQQEFNGSNCSGENKSPHLVWDNAPAGTKSFAVITHDPDAPTHGGFYHWVAFNIPASTTELKTNAGQPDADYMPAGSVMSNNSFGIKGYSGPCPPPGHGPHLYLYTVVALDTDKLDLDKNAQPATVEFTMWPHIIAKASIVNYYERKE